MRISNLPFALLVASAAIYVAAYAGIAVLDFFGRVQAAFPGAV